MEISHMLQYEDVGNGLNARTDRIEYQVGPYPLENRILRNK